MNIRYPIYEGVYRILTFFHSFLFADTQPDGSYLFFSYFFVVFECL